MPMMIRVATLILLLSINALSLVKANESEKAEVVILGVSHSAQLFVQDYRPAILRGWLANASPDVIAVELTPSRFDSKNYYDFTYEIQGVVIPFANEFGIGLAPFDWEPAKKEGRLMFGFDLFHTPTIRPSRGWRSFLSFTGDESELVKHFYIGDQNSIRKRLEGWMDTPATSPQAEAARRLYLYRTFLQARNIEQIARNNLGKRIVVVVGYMHQPDLERVLASSEVVRLISPSEFSVPEAQTLKQYERNEDLYAIAWANLFSTHSELHGFDTEWIKNVLHEIKGLDEGSEYKILKLKYEQRLSAEVSVSQLISWISLAESISLNDEPSWRGGISETRVDSDFEPFSALSLRQRAFHEAAIVACKLRELDELPQLKNQVIKTLSEERVKHYLEYWQVSFEECE